MPVQLLSNVLPMWNVSLVDTPGFGEYNAKVSETAAAALSASSACVYITTSGSFGSKTDTDCFKELHRHGNY
jgi:predicted GTPase